MRQCNKLFGLAASCLTLAAGLTAGNAVAGSGTEYFSAHFKTTESLAPAPSCPALFGGVGAGMGTTNLFKATAPGSTTAVLSSFDCVTPSPDGKTYYFGPGDFTITGSNGDKIYATYSGTLNFSGIDTATGLPIYSFAKDAMFNITHGTGIYANAKGSGTISGTEIINQTKLSAQGSLTAVGTIIY